MKITKSQLKRIIKEELESVLGDIVEADIEREEHEAKTVGQTAKERADEIYMVKQFAKDVADNVESLLTDPKEYVIDPALATVTRGIESAVDRGVTTVEAAWAKLKRISKEVERARWIQATRPDPRPGGTGDYVAPNYSRIVPEVSNLEEQELDPEFPITGSQEFK